MKIDAVQQCFREINQPTWMASVRLGTSKLPESATASNPYQLPKDYPAPRDVLRQHFPRTAKQCNFSGGWGYTIDDAVEVLEYDPEISDQRLDGVSLEYAFVDKRIREELIFAPTARKAFDRLSWQVIEQSLYERGGINYDRLLVEVTVNDETFQTEYWFNISDFY